MTTNPSDNTWMQQFQKQLIDAWETQGLEAELGGQEIDQVASLALLGFKVAAHIASLRTAEEVNDTLTDHMAVVAVKLGDEAALTMMQSVVLNLAVTFTTPALDVLAGTSHDVRRVAQQIHGVIERSNPPESQSVS